MGVWVGVENWLINWQIENFQRIADDLDQLPVGALVDVGHAHIVASGGEQGAMSEAEYIERMPLKIVEVHVHDNDGATDQHLPLGEGTVVIEPILGALERKGFDGIITLEYVMGKMGPGRAAETLRDAAAGIRAAWDANAATPGK